MRKVLSPISAILGFVLLAVGATWPLAARLTTRLPGAPTGDTGVYVWNLWIFRHELIRHGKFPMWTNHIFALTNGTDLSVHNYTVFADLLGLAFIPVFGVVGAFNVIYLLLIASSGYAAFLLVKRLSGSGIEAWIAGAVFAVSPVLIARGTAHFSLVATAPLPIFLLCLFRTVETRRTRDAAITGLVLAWAGYCDAYFPIYCVLMAGVVLAHRYWHLEHAVDPPGPVVARRIVNGLLICVSAVVVWRLWHGESTFTLAGQNIAVRTLYTPVLVLTVLAALRLQLALRVRLAPRPGRLRLAQLARLGASTLLTAAIVLSPILIGLVSRAADGRLPHPSIYWRSSPPGIDLVALLLPNPNHPWFGEFGRGWITRGAPDAFPEFAGSLSLVAISLVLVAAWRTRRAIPRFWMLFTLAFVLLSLGPFVQLARHNTYIPGPWALLRYVPFIDLARSPSRFAIVSTLGLSIMLGFALAAIRREWPRYRRGLTVAAAGLLAFELVPAPRPLFDATVPAVYDVIRADTDETRRVLELPAGVRDGTSSLGDFNADAQYFQTVHRKPLLGGYQSRVSERRKQANLDVPILATLYALSERRAVPEELTQRALATKDQFLAVACVGYVVMNSHRTSPELRAFAISLFDLVPAGADGGRELFIPGRQPDLGHCGRTSLPH